MSDLTANPHVDPLNAQHELQMVAYGIDPTTMRAGEREAFFLWNVFAMNDEIHEAGGEVSWKPWATADFFNREAYIGELVDAFHFFLNLVLIANVPWDEFINRYNEKRLKNLQRQKDGYDGIDNKCPTCKRDLGDVDASRQRTLDRTLTAGRKYAGLMPGDRVFTPDGKIYCSAGCAGDPTTDSVAWPQGTPEEALKIEDYMIPKFSPSTHDPETGAPHVTDQGYQFVVDYDDSEDYTIPKFSPEQKELLLQLIGAAQGIGNIIPPMTNDAIIARADRIHQIEDLKNMIEVLSQ